MPTSKSRKKKPPKRILALPDLEHAKTEALNSLAFAGGQRRRELLATLKANIVGVRTEYADRAMFRPAIHVDAVSRKSSILLKRSFFGGLFVLGMPSSTLGSKIGSLKVDKHRFKSGQA
jgi:hypothetical protein